MQVNIVLFLVVCVAVNAFKNSYSGLKSRFSSRVTPLSENFFLDIDTVFDPAVNTPRELFGEVAYKGYVENYDDQALLLGNYNPINGIRSNKLLSLTADSGLLEALEAKGVTLSQLEKLLPVIDQLGLLDTVSKNKALLLSLAPLLIEPAPLLIPVVVSILKTSPSLFQLPGFALLGAGVYEGTSGDGFLTVVCILLGLPLATLGTILSSSLALPDVPSSIPVTAVSSSPSRSVSASAPKVKAPSVVSRREGGARNGRRKTVKVNRR